MLQPMECWIVNNRNRHALGRGGAVSLLIIGLVGLLFPFQKLSGDGKEEKNR